MGSSYWYDTINLGCSTVSRGVRLYIFKKKYFFLSEYLFNSVDPDEMPHYVAFHLGLHCL